MKKEFNYIYSLELHGKSAGFSSVFVWSAAIRSTSFTASFFWSCNIHPFMIKLGGHHETIFCMYKAACKAAWKIGNFSPVFMAS